MAKRADWPEGLSDKDGVLRLQTVLLQACEGNPDVTNDRDYRSLRGVVVARPDWSDVVPPFVRAHRDLASFWSYIREVSGQWEPRRQHVWNGFKALLDRVEGLTSSPAKSATWTGRRTAAQQAHIVLSLAPEAQLAVEMLLEEQDRALSNGAPVDEGRQNAIETLRALRDELQELITLAEAGQPLSVKLARVRQLKDKALQWVVSPYGLGLGGFPLAGTSTVFGCGVSMLVNVLTKDASLGAAMGTAAAGVYGAAGVQRLSKSEAKQQS